MVLLVCRRFLEINTGRVLKDVEWLSNLKLKASYGTQGNDGILDINGYVVYQPYLKQYSVTNNNGDFSVVETYRGNKDLTWEKAKI